ncbi:MAG TPA: prenyltransferase/squalene oxidase repeat-containing protein [Planctomycetota bacterium]|nr:prenyltransferase/squalene oxidase repeat-containing protein [Planctomycetota bacterium]
MLKNRMLELAVAAAAALGTGCDSTKGPEAQAANPTKPVQAIRFEALTPPAQEGPKTDASAPTLKPPAPSGPGAEFQKEGPTLPIASKLPPGTPVAGVPHESWKGVPLGDPAEKGLKWLVSVQGKDGGWGQDGGNEGDSRKDIGLESNGNDVANTSLVCLALLRSGTTMKDGPYPAALRKGVQYVLENIEAAKVEGLQVTTRQNTQIQRKLGPYIDTFLSTMLLAEIDGRMADEAGQKRVRASLDKCIAKVEKNQQKDGSWNMGNGWAPVIGTSFASRGLYDAQQKGVNVDAACLVKVEAWTNANFDPKTREFKRDTGAGVDLYVAAQSLEQASRPSAYAGRPVAASSRMSAEPGQKGAPSPPPAADPKALADTLPAPIAAMMFRAEAQKLDIREAAGARLGAATFVGGFGSMGGEEFVSYLNISDSLLRSGGKQWGDWNTKIKERLVKLQNQDGTWAGHHCITGRVACTSSAVMTLLAERTAPKE